MTKHTLAPCPNSPNCVSSLSTSRDRHINPLCYTGTVQEAKSRLRTVIDSEPRTRIVIHDDGYIHMEVMSHLFGFVDDVEFLFDDEQKLIHVRSASRTGYWDLGVNRSRVERIRTRFAAHP